MKIYYTGADTYNSEQKDKDKSLGGYKSSTLIPNDILSNLFSEISMYTLDNKLRETRGLIIHNDSGVDYTDLYIYFDKEVDSIGKFEVAAVLLTPNVDGEIFMEEIGNVRGTPFIGNFVEADTVTNQQLLANTFEDNSYIGLWIRRSIEQTTKDIFNCDKLYTDYISVPQGVVLKQGNVDITLSWT